jgi:transcriptional regulator GlxA family with amidase domain
LDLHLRDFRLARQQRYQEIVDHFEKVVRENIGKLDNVADICKIMGVSHRTLARALRSIRGTTPWQDLQSIRLAEARRALLCGKASAESVTQVALRVGFRELGRFSVQYRAAFGESPSGTLRRRCSAARGHPESRTDKSRCSD